jgi:hypothetical protein
MIGKPATSHVDVATTSLITHTVRFKGDINGFTRLSFCNDLVVCERRSGSVRERWVNLYSCQLGSTWY